MSIYTKKGDLGSSSTIKRMSIFKRDVIFDLLGNLDELNVALGGCKLVSSVSIKAFIELIQQDIFTISGFIAKEDFSGQDYLSRRVIEFEKVMDKNPLNLESFVFPGRSNYEYQFHFCRVTARRAERSLSVFATDERYSKMDISGVQKYLNRLSDLLFVFSQIDNISL